MTDRITPKQREPLSVNSKIKEFLGMSGLSSVCITAMSVAPREIGDGTRARTILVEVKDVSR